MTKYYKMREGEKVSMDNEYVYFDGEDYFPVEILKTGIKNTIYSVAVVIDKEEFQEGDFFIENGCRYIDDYDHCLYRTHPLKHSKWVVAYRERNGASNHIQVEFFDSFEEAKIFTENGKLAIFSIREILCDCEE